VRPSIGGVALAVEDRSCPAVDLLRRSQLRGRVRSTAGAGGITTGSWSYQPLTCKTANLGDHRGNRINHNLRSVERNPVAALGCEDVTAARRAPGERRVGLQSPFRGTRGGDQEC